MQCTNWKVVSSVPACEVGRLALLLTAACARGAGLHMPPVQNRTDDGELHRAGRHDCFTRPYKFKFIVIVIVYDDASSTVADFPCSRTSLLRPGRRRC